MRWDSLRLDDDAAARQPGSKDAPVVTDESVQAASPAQAARPSQAALFDRAAITRTFDTPGFRGMIFHEVHSRSLISKVPEASRMAFRWTINPYRGCSHACAYCFARNTHTYLDLDSWHDFDTQIVVKVNAPELLRRGVRGTPRERREQQRGPQPPR